MKLLILLALGVCYTWAAPMQHVDSNVGIGVSQKSSVDFTVNFFGKRFNKLWIQWKAGLITFDQLSSYDTDEIKSFPNPNYRPDARATANMDSPLIAAYYANVKKFHGANITKVSPTKGAPGSSEVSKWCRDLVHANVPESGDFKCDSFVLVSWLGSGPGGKYNEIPRNTFQVLIATQDVNSFVIFNYETLDWHADLNNGGDSTGKIIDPKSQSFPKAGFNMGEGRRFVALPFSGRHEVIDLDKKVATQLPSHWKNESQVHGVFVYKVSGKAERMEGSCHLGALTVTDSADTYALLQSLPPTGYFLGGQEITVRGQCYSPDVEYDLRFETDPPIMVDCKYVDRLSIKCILSQWFLRRGYIPFRLYEDQHPTGFTGNFYATLIEVGVVMQNYPAFSGSLDIKEIPIQWNSRIFEDSEADHLVVSLYGYREVQEGKPIHDEIPIIANFTKLWSTKINNTINPTFQLVKSLGNVSSPSLTSYVINAAEAQCSSGAECKLVDSGAFAVEDPVSGKRLWTRPFQLGWLYSRLAYEKKMTAELCLKRFYLEKEEKGGDHWRKAVPKCPCSLQQVVVDRRFVREDEYLGLGDSTRCYVSYPIRGSTGASQCCYRVSDEGLLVYSNDSASPEVIDSPMMKAHYLGGFPFARKGRVPVFSYLSTDAILKYTCCKWSKEISPTSCSYYKDLRATQDCSNYSTPFLATTYGLGHFKTLRGTFYQFYGTGDYELLRSDAGMGDELIVQGRFQPVMDVVKGESVGASGLTAVGTRVACKYGASNAYVQHTRNNPPGIYVYVDGVKQDYLTIRANGRQIYKNIVESPCITVIYELKGYQESLQLQLADGAVVQVTAVSQVLNVEIQLPNNQKQYPTMPKYSGLFGELSDKHREPGADLCDGDGNILVEPEDLVVPARIATFTNHYLIRNRYESVMHWYSESISPLNYNNPDFQAVTRLHKETRYRIIDNTNTTTTTTTTSTTTTTTTTTTKSPTTAATMTTTAEKKIENSTKPAEPVNVLRKRRDTYKVSFLETADAYDYRMTLDVDLQKATKAADTDAAKYQTELFEKQGTYCPFLNIPNAIKSSKDTRLGAEVEVKGCNEGFTLVNLDATLYKCTGSTNSDVKTAKWQPEPGSHCSTVTSTREVSQDSQTTLYIILIAVAGVVVIIIIVIVIMIVRNKSSKTDKVSNAEAKYGLEGGAGEEGAPLNRPTSEPMSATSTTTSGSGAGNLDNSYTSPVTIQPPIAFPPSEMPPPHSPAPVVRQEDDV